MSKQHLDPARSLIEKAGGPARVARVLGLNRSTVARWMYPRDEGGTGGLVPAQWQRALLEYARRERLPLTERDFFGAVSERRVA